MGTSLNAFGKTGEKVLVLDQHATVQNAADEDATRHRKIEDDMLALLDSMKTRMNIKACPAKTRHLFHALKALRKLCQVQIGLGFSPAINRVL